MTTQTNPEQSHERGVGAEARVSAGWELSLYCDCPICGASVDLLDVPNFWDGRALRPCEHGTDRSRGVEVSCPICQEDFVVDLVF